MGLNEKQPYSNMEEETSPGESASNVKHCLDSLATVNWHKIRLTVACVAAGVVTVVVLAAAIYSFAHHQSCDAGCTKPEAGSSKTAKHGQVMPQVQKTTEAVVTEGSSTPGVRSRYSINTVAFSATQTDHHKTTGDAHTKNATLLFESCHLNIGNGFNVTSGVFRPPIAGLYMFSFHALSGSSHKRFAVALYHNGVRTVAAYARVAKYWAMGGNSVILDLKVGDTAELRFMFGHSELWGSSGERYATFNGFLIAPSAF